MDYDQRFLIFLTTQKIKRNGEKCWKSEKAEKFTWKKNKRSKGHFYIIPSNDFTIADMPALYLNGNVTRTVLIRRLG